MQENIVENYEILSDDSIASLVIKGDYEKMGIIINRYYPIIIMYVNKLCPAEYREDAIQEATFALFCAIKSYDSHKSTFSTFAGVCIKRSVIAFLKTLNRKKTIPPELLSSINDIEIADSNSPEKIFFDRSDYEALTDSIKSVLSSLEYSVLQYYILGYRYSVIADKLGLTEKAVSNAMLRIRKKLKK